MKCDLDGDTLRHISGLRTMPHAPGMEAVLKVMARVPPGLCPVSKNPRLGSEITLRYRPNGKVLETYSLGDLLDAFRGGFPGRGPYRAERNMEGMVHLVCQMAADALGVRVFACARLYLDTGYTKVALLCHPQEGTNNGTD